MTAGAFGTNSVTMTVPAPGGATILEVYAVGWAASSAPPTPGVNYNIDVDPGSGWQSVVSGWQITNPGYASDDWWSESFCYGKKDVSVSGANSVQVRFTNDGGKAFRKCEVYLVYAADNTSETKVTFCWDDAGGTGKTANHTYAAGQTTPDSTWTVATGTSTVTKWVETECIAVAFVDVDGDGMDDAWEITNFTNLTTANATSSYADGDIASDLLEYLAGKNPKANDFTSATDTDTDGLPDFWEFFFFTSLTQANGTTDTDGDAATDLLEYLAGGNAANPGASTYNPEVSDFTVATDSDGDDMPDVWEYTNFGDLAETGAADNDSDGLANNLEDDNSTDPQDNDTDNDGLSDGAEVNTYLTDPLDTDSDNDGYSDSAEVTAGTDPNDGSDHPTTTSKGKSSGGGCGAGAAGMLMGLIALFGIERRTRRS
ncbi:MAG: hypothetical protein ABIF71_15960 [Planctomycetota bacterium]